LIIIVAIIARFKPILSNHQIGPSDGIAALGQLARVAASVRVDCVSVIALLASFKLSVATACLGLAHHHLL
jgi:hypothetical protein